MPPSSDSWPEPSSSLSFWTADGDLLVPEPVAQSLWSEDQAHGVAVSGALARGLERAAAHREELQPVRYHVDLFRPARMRPCRVETEVVRDGPRLCLVDARMVQEDVVVARASVLLLKPGGSAPGEVWRSPETFAPPPEDLAPPTDQPRVPLFASEGGRWSEEFSDHQNAARKSTWQVGVPVVPGEPPSPFVAVASAADATSMVTHWGSGGIEFINTDITLSLVRLPRGIEVGITTIDRVAADGLAVGTAAVYDREGRLGTTAVTALANSRRTVGFDDVDEAIREDAPRS